MKKYTLEQKIRLRIKKSRNTAFLSRDFFDLSDGDQVGRVLRILVKKNVLIKLGRGIFAKTKKSTINNKYILEKNFADVAKEALHKLKIKTFLTAAENNYNKGLSTQIPTGLLIGVNKRVSRTLTYNGRKIKYEQVSY